MARKDNRLRQPSFPDTEIGNLLAEADRLKYEKIYNYEYTYYSKTPKGMREDIPTNHKYGNEREGYESWQEDNIDYAMSYAGVTSVREIYKRDNPDVVVGYMFEKKLSDRPWIGQIDELFDKAWQIFIKELDIKDPEAMDYFLFGDLEFGYGDNGDSTIHKFNTIIKCITKYNDDEEYRKLIDKIKG